MQRALGNDPLTVIPSVADSDLELTASERDRFLENLKQHGEELLARGRDQMRAYGVAAVRTVVMSAPSLSQEIGSFAERERIDLIVIGSQGRNANRRFDLGRSPRTWCVTVPSASVWYERAIANERCGRARQRTGPLFFPHSIRYNDAT